MIPFTLDSILDGILDDEREWDPDEGNSFDNDGPGMESSNASTPSSLSPNTHGEVSFSQFISDSTVNESLVSVNPRSLNTDFVSSTLDPSVSCLNLDLNMGGSMSYPKKNKQLSDPQLDIKSPLFVPNSSANESPYSSTSAESISPFKDLKRNLSIRASVDSTLNSRAPPTETIKLLSTSRVQQLEKLDLTPVFKHSGIQHTLNSTSTNNLKDISRTFLKNSSGSDCSEDISSQSLCLSPSTFDKTSLSPNSEEISTGVLSGIPCISIKTELPDSCSMGVMVRL